MPIKHVKYDNLRQLLQHERVTDEDPTTADLIHRLRHVKREGEFSRAEFLEMCRWKSPRAIRHYERNSPGTIRRVSRAVLATRSERKRMEALTSLDGVSIPMASAILTLIDPERYGVLDIRAWQLLFAIDSVRRNPRGRGFTFTHWHQYLRQLRRHSREFRVSARAVELTLFKYHRKIQKGRLYN